MDWIDFLTVVSAGSVSAYVAFKSRMRARTRIEPDHTGLYVLRPAPELWTVSLGILLLTLALFASAWVGGKLSNLSGGEKALLFALLIASGAGLATWAVFARIEFDDHSLRVPASPWRGALRIPWASVRRVCLGSIFKGRLYIEGPAGKRLRVDFDYAGIPNLLVYIERFVPPSAISKEVHQLAEVLESQRRDS